MVISQILIEPFVEYHKVPFWDPCFFSCILMTYINPQISSDDTSLTYANGDLKKLETEVNNELSKVCSWLVVNKLTLNIEKTNYIIFRPRQKTIPFHPNIKIINNNSNISQPLEMKDYIRYLGILIDSNLSWKFHIDYVCQKVSKTIGIIAKLRHFVPRHVLLTLYRSLILPYISYSICAWGHAAQTHLHKLLVLQKRALRLMFFAEPRTHAVPLFLETKQLPISFLLFEQMSLLMYDVHNNLAPDNIKNMFTKLSSVHSYRTRSVITNENYYVEQVRTENMKRAFSVSGALIWNSIPLSIKTLKKNQFKSELKRKLFEILEKEDDYIRVFDITGKFSKA